MTNSRDQTREDLPMTAKEKGEWVSDGRLEHLRGVPWYQAATPWIFHRCKPQTRGIISGSLIERCACGAIRRDGHPWMERNTVRSKQPKDDLLIIGEAIRSSSHAGPGETQTTETDHPSNGRLRNES